MGALYCKHSPPESNIRYPAYLALWRAVLAFWEKFAGFQNFKKKICAAARIFSKLALPPESACTELACSLCARLTAIAASRCAFS